MSTGRMLEEEIGRTDALTEELRRIYAYLESVCPPDFVVEAKRAAKGDLAEDGSCNTSRELPTPARQATRSQLVPPEGAGTSRNEIIEECAKVLDGYAIDTKHRQEGARMHGLANTENAMRIQSNTYGAAADLIRGLKSREPQREERQ